jgi:CRP/FNR family transcriptional regulator, cyclic AMP receptor protein
LRPAESLHIVEAMRHELAHDPFIVQPWTSGVFGASNFPIDDLKRQLDESDFAVLVIGPDVTSRGKRFLASRDNVIFELGLFMGALGRERTFIAQERGRDLKIPSDLFGLGTIRFAPGGQSFGARAKASLTNSRRHTPGHRHHDTSFAIGMGLMVTL